VPLTRQRLVAVSALAVVLALGVGAPSLALIQRSEAVQARAEAEETLRRLVKAHQRLTLGTDETAPPAEAPAVAFLDAQTLGLALAQLETYLSTVARSDHAGVASLNAKPADRGDPADVIRIEANIDLDYQQLQPLLYALEAGAPYVFVESLTLRPASVQSHRDSHAVPIRAILDLKALWRQGPT
jgi:general secretion pathway protein M